MPRIPTTPPIRLNVVVGPNGTGKSTILCAICLGLGGQPPLLGRADDARLFIKHEREEATIEIELAPHVDPHGRRDAVHVIRRVIDRDRGSENGRGVGASVFYVNGHKSNLRSVRELVSERYKIHIDNLCTFLPQDKVGSFSGFDRQALLIETEKALSEELHTTHGDLIELERALQSSGTDVAGIEDELAKLTRENERLEREKELMEERASCLEKIDLLKKKRAWLVFDQKREEAKAAKERREEVKRLKREAETAVRPLAERHAHVGGEHSRVQGRYRASEAKLKKDRVSFEECLTKSDHYTDEVEQVMNEYRTIDAQQRKAERDVEKERARLEQISEEGRDYPPIAEIERTIRETQKEMVTIKGRIGRERSKMGEMVARIEEAEQEKKDASDRLERLQDDKKLRLENFCRQVEQVGQAYKFVDENRKMFRRKVWGPIAAEVQPENQLTASYLENHVAQSTWKSFVVECKEDYDLLYREVREKRGISINIIIVNNGKHEVPPRMYSNERMNVLKREHGFLAYLDETFAAPDVIMQALISRHNVDKVLVGGEAVHNSLERKDLIEFLSARESNDGRRQGSCFFYTYKDASFKYTSNVSRYSGEVGTVTDEISPARVLKPGSDPRLKDQLAETIQKADSRVAKLVPEVDAIKAVLAEMNAQGQNISQIFKQAKNTKAEYGHYQMKLKNARDKLEEAQENASKDNGKEKAMKVAKIKKLVENSIGMSETAADLHNQIMKGTHTLTGLKMMDDASSELLRQLT
jgi:chromosome segregation ATPase